MFGLVMAGESGLTEEEKTVYYGYYCGLCRKLGERGGLKGRMTLTFDLTFLALFLSGYYDAEEIRGEIRCPAHPKKKKVIVTTAMTDYAADMNLILSYEKCRDDWQDEKKLGARAVQASLEKTVEACRKRYPQKTEAIRKYLQDLSTIEASDEHNFDIPANCFGSLMGELFDVYGNDENLHRFGFLLGKVVYVMDACLDLHDDLKKCRYNPMVETSSSEFQQILTVLLSDCTKMYDTIPLDKYHRIVESVLYAGIWQQYEMKQKKQEG